MIDGNELARIRAAQNARHIALEAERQHLQVVTAERFLADCDRKEANRAAEENQIADSIIRTVKDSRFEPRIAHKVARAVSRGLLSQSDYCDVLSSMDKNGIRVRGAYAVSAFKKAFARRNLSWMEEDWLLDEADRANEEYP